jgi:NMDA receptor-regulated protein 1
MTLRAYVSVLRYEDVVHGHDFFCTAASGIIRIYLHMYDNPASNDSDEPDYSKMSAAERKKAKAIARKKKKASEKKESELMTNDVDTQNGSKKSSQKGKPLSVIDEDPLGKEFLAKAPLEEAKKYSSMLAKYAPKNLETWILQYDVAVRRKKPMLALQALYKAKSIDSESHNLFSRMVDFSEKVNSYEESSDAVRTVLSENTTGLFDNKSAVDYISEFACKIQKDPMSDLPLRTVVAKALVDKKIGTIDGTLSLITACGMECRAVSVETCLEALNFLKSQGDGASSAAKLWMDLMKARYPSVAC